MNLPAGVLRRANLPCVIHCSMRQLEPHYTLKQAAERYFSDGPITPATLRNAIKKGLLQATMPEGKLLVTEAWLVEWLERCRVQEATPSPTQENAIRRARLDHPRRRGSHQHRLRRRHDDAKAQRALADYINGKYQPPTGLGAKLLIDEVVAAYLAGHADGSASRDFLLATATPILEWWTGKRISEVNKTNCRAYVKWRTSQFRKRHPNSKKPPVKVSDQTARHDLKTCGRRSTGTRASTTPR